MAEKTMCRVGLKSVLCETVLGEDPLYYLPKTISLLKNVNQLVTLCCETIL